MFSNLFDTVFSSLDDVYSRFLPTETNKSDLSPTFKTFDHKDKAVLRAVMPGISTEDLNISINGDVVTMDAKHEDNYSKVSYSRTFTVPITYDLDKMTATLKDGILTLELPKRNKIKSTEDKKIEVKKG